MRPALLSSYFNFLVHNLPPRMDLRRPSVWDAVLRKNTRAPPAPRGENKGVSLRVNGDGHRPNPIQSGTKLRAGNEIFSF